MKKFQLSIPTPCHENWQAMTPENKGRFCTACQKTVIDFSTMSDRQLAEFFKKPAGSVCGRFSNHQLDRAIEDPRKRLPWIRYFFTITLPAFLWSMKASAQGEVRVSQKLGKVAVCQKPEKDTAQTPVGNAPEQIIVKGKIVDENGVGIPHASIVFKGTQTGVSADQEGRFEWSRKDAAMKEIVVSSVGYESVTIQTNSPSFQTVTLRPRIMDYLGVVVVTERRKPKLMPLIETAKKDTTLARFSVYPNPATSGSTIFLDVNKLEKGRYEMAILSGSGELVQANEVNIEASNKKHSANLSILAAGSYFVRLTNKKSGKSYTEIIVVQ